MLVSLSHFAVIEPVWFVYIIISQAKRAGTIQGRSPGFVAVQLRLFPPAVAIVVVVSAVTRVLSCIPTVAPVVVVVIMLLLAFMANFSLSLSRYY